MDKISKKKIFKNFKYTKIVQPFKKSKFLSDHSNLWALVIIVLLNALNWGLIAYFIRPTDYPIVLHYNAHFGIDLIGSWQQVYLIPALGSFLGIFNYTIAWILFNKEEKVISNIALLAAIILQVGLIIAAISVILINR